MNFELALLLNNAQDGLFKIPSGVARRSDDQNDILQVFPLAS